MKKLYQKLIVDRNFCCSESSDDPKVPIKEQKTSDSDDDSTLYQMSEEDLEDYEKFFELADVDEDGKISVEEGFNFFKVSNVEKANLQKIWFVEFEVFRNSLLKFSAIGIW